MATHSSVLAWRIPGMGELGGVPSMGSHRVGHDWSDLAAYLLISIIYRNICLIATSSFLNMQAWRSGSYLISSTVASKNIPGTEKIINKCLLTAYSRVYHPQHCWHLGLTHCLQWGLFHALKGAEQHSLALPVSYYSTFPSPWVVTMKNVSRTFQVSSGVTGESHWSTEMREDLADAPKRQSHDPFGGS